MINVLRPLPLFAVFTSLLVAGLVAAFSFWYWQGLQAPQVGSDEPQLVQIEPGVSSDQIAAILSEQDIIANSRAFRLYLRLHGLSGDLKAGSYHLHSFLSASEVARILTEGESATVQVTIISGQRLDQIADTLKDTGYAPSDVDSALAATYDHPVLADKPATASLEGYLFPDTYEVRLGAPASELVERMLDNLDVKLTGEIRAGWAARGLDLHQGLTLASIVHNEMSDLEGQRQVAQVFLSRLDEGMRLEADPTFRYPAALLDVTPSIEIDSPYNTYRNDGLPPGPISNVEVTALMAVADPTATDYLYFVTGEDGVTRFSRTFEEHQRRIDEYGISKP